MVGIIQEVHLVDGWWLIIASGTSSIPSIPPRFLPSLSPRNLSILTTPIELSILYKDCINESCETWSLPFPPLHVPSSLLGNCCSWRFTWEKKDKLKLTNKHQLALLIGQNKQSYLVLYSVCNFKSWCDGQTDEMNYKYLNIEMRGDVNITVLRWSSFIREFHSMMNCLISGISSLQAAGRTGSCGGSR